MVCKSLSLFICFLAVTIVFAVGAVVDKLPTTDMVEEQINLLKESETPDLGSLEQLEKIKDNQQKILELKQENAQLQLLLQQAPERKIALQKKLQQVLDTEIKALSKSTLASEIEQNLATQRARNKEWIAQLAELEKRQQSLLEAQETLPVAIAEQEQMLNKQISDNKITQEIIDNKINTWLIDTQEALHEEKLKGLVLQQDTLVQRRELAKIEAQILDAQLTLNTKKIELLQVRLLALSTQ